MPDAPTENAAPCEHDWRRDPFTMLTSYPPCHRVVCATCGEQSTRRVDDGNNYDRTDPRTWPHAD